MELLASGFNAWGQLDFANSQPQLVEDAPDFPKFESVWRGETINQVQAFLSYTTCRLAVHRAIQSCTVAYKNDLGSEL